MILRRNSCPTIFAFTVYLPVACKTHSEKVEIRKGGGGLGLVINIGRKTEMRQKHIKSE